MTANAKDAKRFFSRALVWLGALGSSAGLLAHAANADNAWPLLQLHFDEAGEGGASGEFADVSRYNFLPFESGSFESSPHVASSPFGNVSMLGASVTLSYPVDNRAFLQIGCTDYGRFTQSGLFGNDAEIGGTCVLTSKKGVYSEVEYWYDHLMTANPHVLKIRMRRQVQQFTGMSLDVGSPIGGSHGRRMIRLDIGHSF
jgi:hypothetical protein